MIVANKKFSKNRFCIGSALILTVVLTSLLAIIGVLFLMTARVDRMATSAVSQQKELNLAIDTITERISSQLIWDVPGVNFPGRGLPEYHDYPGPLDRWLASLEPNDSRMWQQISDVTGYLQFRGWPTNDIPIAKIADHSPILLDPADGSLLEQLADADGDGAADSKWIMLDNMTSGKGIPIYAAIRVVDNVGMLNVNAGFKFDPCDPCDFRIDGTSQMQINLMALAGRPLAPPTAADEAALLLARANYGVGLDPNNLTLYENNVIWQYGELLRPYTPFDISDELELRNRFLLNQRDTWARIEAMGYPDDWTDVFRIGLAVPISSVNGTTLDNWFAHANSSVDLTRYDYRHIATTCSMDRIITPLGPKFSNGKMVNVNTAPGVLLHSAIMTGFLDADPALAGADGLAAQITANIIDFYDTDSQVTTIFDANGTRYYGFERPCIYISELDYNQVTITSGSPPTATTYKSYAVELYKPYTEDLLPIGDWRLVVDGNSVITIDSSLPDKNFYILRNQVPPEATLPLDLTNGVLKDSPSLVFAAGSKIELQRKVTDPNGTPKFITVDTVPVPPALVTGDGLRSLQRDITLHKCIRRLWDSVVTRAPTLGSVNGFADPSTDLVQAHPYLDPAIYTDRFTGGVGFKNIGEIGMVFTRSGYNVFPGSTEADLRLDFKNPLFANLLNYLTVIDPWSHGGGFSETRIKGRINVNTAPPFVIGQLPWMAPDIAKTVVGFRDTVIGGFRNTGQLTWVASAPGFPGMDFLATDGVDQQGFPDLTPLKLLGNADGCPDDFEERDLIFHRISNLVTVRSDVFTAYILVRIGPDGPQKRVIAILDRSDVCPDDKYPFTSGEVKVRALHPVPDPW